MYCRNSCKEKLAAAKPGDGVGVAITLTMPGQEKKNEAEAGRTGRGERI